MPAVLENLFPPLGRKHLRNAFHKLYTTTCWHAQKQGYSESDPLYRLWQFLTGNASFLVQRMFDEEVHPESRWSLKKHWACFDPSNVHILFYWILVFVLKRFEELGDQRLKDRRTINKLTILVNSWPDFYISLCPEGLQAERPPTVPPTWVNDDHLKMLFDMYNAIYALIDVTPDPVTRALECSFFSSAIDLEYMFWMRAAMVDFVTSNTSLKVRATRVQSG